MTHLSHEDVAQFLSQQLKFFSLTLCFAFWLNRFCPDFYHKLWIFITGNSGQQILWRRMYSQLGSHPVPFHRPGRFSLPSRLAWSSGVLRFRPGLDGHHWSLCSSDRVLPALLLLLSLHHLRLYPVVSQPSVHFGLDCLSCRMGLQNCQGLLLLWTVGCLHLGRGMRHRNRLLVGSGWNRLHSHGLFAGHLGVPIHSFCKVS